MMAKSKVYIAAMNELLKPWSANAAPNASVSIAKSPTGAAPGGSIGATIIKVALPIVVNHVVPVAVQGANDGIRYLMKRRFGNKQPQ